MKKFIVLLPIILASLFGYYYNFLRETRPQFEDQREFGGILWPAGSYYELNADGNIIIELDENLKLKNDHWKSGSRFHFSADSIVKIEAKAPFQFSQINFESDGVIKKEDISPNTLYKIKFKHEQTIDGLEIKPDCEVEFKNNVLYSAKCPEFDKVYFKRFVNLPEVNSNEENRK